MQALVRTTNTSRTGLDTGLGWMGTSGPIWSAAIPQSCRRISRPAMSRASIFEASLEFGWKTICTSPRAARSCSRRRVRHWKIRSEGKQEHQRASLRFTVETPTSRKTGQKWGTPEYFLRFRTLDFSFVEQHWHVIAAARYYRAAGQPRRLSPHVRSALMFLVQVGSLESL